MENYVINPITNRPILFNGSIYRRLLKKNLIQPIPKKDQKDKKDKTMTDDNEDEEKTDDEDITIQELFNKLNSKQ